MLDFRGDTLKVNSNPLLGDPIRFLRNHQGSYRNDDKKYGESKMKPNFGTVNFERRNHPRFSVNLPVEYRKIDNAKGQPANTVLPPMRLSPFTTDWD